MKILMTQSTNIPSILAELLNQRSKSKDLTAGVKIILDDVQENGDSALFRLTKKFDGVALKALKVSKAEIQRAYEKIDKETLAALGRAKENIEIFHTQMLNMKENVVESEEGVRVWREFRPIEKVGLYIPGGKASYPSTVLMLGVPARIAGCKEIAMCIPPAKDGSLPATTLVAADMCGITNIFKVGGAQAIAAMAYGTKSIPKVSKIFGPGNSYVLTAKMLVYGEVNIDMPAGPSEVAVIADETAKASWIAADLLSQLEHGEDSKALLVSSSGLLAEKVIKEMIRQTALLPRREIIEKSFKKSFTVIVRSIEEAIEIMNEYAPEHLEIVTKSPGLILKKINNVGSVFLGPYTCEPLGDYATGANHTLPTSGFAKMFPPLSTESFGKMIQIQKVSKKGIFNLRKTAEILAKSEGLDAHARSVEIRFDSF